MFRDSEDFYQRQKSLEEQLQALAGPAAEEGPGFFESYVRRPVGQFFGRTQSLITEPLLGGTEAYQQAAQELQQMTGRPEGDWEALPGLGDVLATQLPESARHGVFIEPVTRFAGNVVGDPTNWTPAILGKASMKLAGPAIQAGRLAKVQEAGAAVDEAVRAGMSLEEALKVPAATGVDALEAALKSGNPVERYKAAKTLIEASGNANVAQTYTRLAGLGLGTDAAMMGAAGVAFAPDIAKASGQAFGQAWESFQEGELGQAAAAGTTGVLMAGLGGLMAKGMIDAGRASSVLYEHLAKNDPGAAAKLAQNAQEKSIADFDEWFPTDQPGWQELPVSQRRWPPPQLPEPIPAPWEPPPVPPGLGDVPVPPAPGDLPTPGFGEMLPTLEEPPRFPPVIEPPVPTLEAGAVPSLPDYVVPPTLETAARMADRDWQGWGDVMGTTGAFRKPVVNPVPVEPPTTPVVEPAPVPVAAEPAPQAPVPEPPAEPPAEPVVEPPAEQPVVEEAPAPEAPPPPAAGPAEDLPLLDRMTGVRNFDPDNPEHWGPADALMSKLGVKLPNKRSEVPDAKASIKEKVVEGVEVDGRPLTAEEAAQARNKFYAMVGRRGVRLEEEADKLAKEQAAAAAREELGVATPAETPAAPVKGSVKARLKAEGARQDAKDIAARINARMSAQWEQSKGRTNINFVDPEKTLLNVADAVAWVAAKMREGGYTIEAAARELIERFPEWKDIIPDYIEDIWRAAKREFNPTYGKRAPREAERVQLQQYHRDALAEFEGNRLGDAPSYRDMADARKEIIQKTVTEMFSSPGFAATPDKESALAYVGGAVRRAKLAEKRTPTARNPRNPEVAADQALKLSREEGLEDVEALDRVMGRSATMRPDMTPEELAAEAEATRKIKGEALDIMQQRRTEEEALGREVEAGKPEAGPINRTENLLKQIQEAEGDTTPHALYRYWREGGTEEAEGIVDTLKPSEFPEQVRDRDAAAAKMSLYALSVLRHGEGLSGTARARSMRDIAHEYALTEPAYLRAIPRRGAFNESEISRIKKAYTRKLASTLEAKRATLEDVEIIRKVWKRKGEAPGEGGGKSRVTYEAKLPGGEKVKMPGKEEQALNRFSVQQPEMQAGLVGTDDVEIKFRPTKTGTRELGTRTPRELVNERQFGPQQPGVEPGVVEGEPTRVSVDVATGRPPASRGVGDKTVVPEFRLQGKNGTWVDIARADTPAAARGEMRVGTAIAEATEEGFVIAPDPATALQLKTAGSVKGDHTAESIADVLRPILRENKQVTTLSVPLTGVSEVRPSYEQGRYMGKETGYAGGYAISPTIEKALGILEKEGLIRSRYVGAAYLSGEAPRVAPSRPAGRSAVAPSAPPGPGVGVQLATEIEGYRKDVRSLREQAAAMPSKTKAQKLKRQTLLEQADRLETTANALYEKLKSFKKPTAEFETSRVMKLMEEERQKAGSWPGVRKGSTIASRAGEPAAGQTRRPVARVYEVGGPERRVAAAERQVANMAMIPDEELSPAQLRLRQAHDLDSIDSATKVGDVAIVNADGTHDADTLRRYAAAHAKLFPVLERVSREISDKLGLGARLKGVVASPFRTGMLVGEDLRGGDVYLNPLQALYEAKAAKQGYQEAARRTVFRQLLHELSHAYDNATIHGEGFDTRVQDLVKRASEVQADVDRWIAQIADEANWRELEALHDEYRKLVEGATGGRIRESWRGAEEGIGGVRTGAPEGRAAPLPDRPAQAAYGAEAGRGVGVRPGAAVPEGAGRAAGAVGEATAGRPGGERGGAGGRAGATPKDSEYRRRVAAFFRRPGNIEEARKAIDAFHNIRGRPDELMLDATHWASEYMRLLREAKNGGNQAAADEWAKRAASRPDPKGGEMWSRINNVMTDLDDDTKVTIQVWSEITRAHPELRKSFDADQPMNYFDIPDEAKAILDVGSPSELEQKWKKGLRLSFAETHALRIVGNDVMYNINQLEARLADALTQASTLTGADQARFIAEKVDPIRTELVRQNNRLFVTLATINEGTEWGRKGAIRRLKIAASDPQMQDFYAMREGVREMVGSRFKNKVERDRIVDELMAAYRDGRFKPDWSTKGAHDWYKLYQKMMKFTSVDKALQFFKAGLLGWPSRVANVSSNTGFVFGLRKLEDALATAIEHGAAKVQGRQPERYVQELPLQMAAARRAMHGGIGEWVKEQKNAFLARPLEFGGAASHDMRHELVQMPSAIGGKWGEFVSFQFKGMNADDALFKHMIKVDQWYKQVYRNVRNNVNGFGIRPGETAITATERLVDELETNLKSFYSTQTRLDSRFKDIIESAAKVAARDTFQEELPGWAKGIQQSFYRGGGKAFQVPVPFFKTPFNIAREVLKRTPIGLAWDLPKALRKGGMTRAQRVDMASRHMVSAAIGAGLFSMLDPDVLSGSGPLDPEANALKQRTGWRPYSIKIGGEWRSYQRLEPISSLLGMVADAREGLELGDFDRYETGMARILGSVAENITNKTFLSGLENLNLAMSDPIRYANEWVKRTQASLMPNSIGFVPVGHLATTLDPVYRETEAFTTSPWVAKVPGLSKTLRPQYSPTGEIRERPGTLGPRFLSPIVSSPERTDPVAKAAQMLADINFPMRRVRPVLDYKGIKVKLDPDEQRELARAQEEAMKFIGTRLMKDPNFQRLPDNEEMADYPGQRTKKDVIARIVRRYRNPVMARLRPELRQRAATHLKEERASASGA